MIAPKPEIIVTSGTSIQEQTTGYTLELELKETETLVVQQQSITLESWQTFVSTEVILPYPETKINIEASNRWNISKETIIITRPQMEYDKRRKIMDDAKELFPDIMMATYVADELTQRKFWERLWDKRNTYYIQARHDALMKLLDNNTYDSEALKELTLDIYIDWMDGWRQKPTRNTKEVYKIFMEDSEYKERLAKENEKDEINEARNNVIKDKDNVYLNMFTSCQLRVNCDDCNVPYIIGSRNNIFKWDTDKDLVIQWKVKWENAFGGKVTQKLSCYYKYNENTKMFDFIDLEIH